MVPDLRLGVFGLVLDEGGRVETIQCDNGVEVVRFVAETVVRVFKGSDIEGEGEGWKKVEE